MQDEEIERIQSKVDKLKHSKFKQQMLPAWRPVPSFGSTMIIFAVFGVVFLSLGIVLYIMSDKIQDSLLQYDVSIENGGCGVPTHVGGRSDAGKNECVVDLKIDTKIEGPIYVYYQLENFYQNHRRYVKSRSNTQLLGEDLALDSSAIKDCDPIITNEELQFTDSIQPNGSGGFV